VERGGDGPRRAFPAPRNPAASAAKNKKNSGRGTARRNELPNSASPMLPNVRTGKPAPWTSGQVRGRFSSPVGPPWVITGALVRAAARPVVLDRGERGSPVTSPGPPTASNYSLARPSTRRIAGGVPQFRLPAARRSVAVRPAARRWITTVDSSAVTSRSTAPTAGDHAPRCACAAGRTRRGRNGSVRVAELGSADRPPAFGPANEGTVPSQRSPTRRPPF